MAVISYKNLLAYVQRQIDRLLRAHQAFARAYINDVVIFLVIMEDYIQYLRAVFSLFVKFNISISP